MFYAHPPSGHPQSVINLNTMITSIKTINKLDDRAWIREDTLTMLLATARLRHLQKTHMGMKWYNNDGATE